ncbi:flagellin [Cytobacillus oceanisediminis]|uniref:flagellin N-terminal helical domain-containing protein n=1 Tax=Cytobacillus TaxID=2675230 RepID=UPI00203E1E90|nr:flagellin [Cytobacillus oceanisediminis]MBY0158797.1 flagellin [Cytobacillus firmus]MCM3529133.1 flagellin [Cytobacillus oceanisediminis]
MRINHNIAALNTYRQLNSASTAQSKSMEKLSSGLRINKAGDDAAGLAISEKMRGQIRGLDQASKNSQDAISLVQTAEGALNETHDILQRMRELAVQAGNDTNTTSDREEIQKEINQMTSEINRIGNTTEFNTQKLLNGSKDVATTAVAASATTAIGGVAGFNISAGAANTTLANGINITFTKGATAGAAFNAAGDTLTVTLDQADATIAASDIEALIQGTTTNVPTGLDMSEFTVTGGANIDGTAATVNETTSLAGGSDAGASLQFQIGANENQSLTLDISDMRAKALGISTEGTADAKRAVTDGTSSTTTEQALSVLTHEDAAATVTTIQSAIDKVSAERSKLGANQNRLEHTINNLSTSSENLTAAESRIRDVDMAKEMMNQTKNSILSQAAQAMLAQANQQPQGVLQLLR